MNASIVVLEGGYWYKIEARRTDVTLQRPHGISYVLSLHASDGKRLLCFDNAHAVKEKNRNKYRARRIEYDHKHRNPDDKGVPYDFSGPYQLIEDFFTAYGENS